MICVIAGLKTPAIISLNFLTNNGNNAIMRNNINAKAMSIMIDTIEKQEIKTDMKEPNLWNVIMHDDNQTPMDFVTRCLVTIFDYTVDEANKAMLDIHSSGGKVIGSYPYDVADEKCHEAISLARSENHPLRVTIEEDE